MKSTRNEKQDVRIKVDGYTRFCLTVIAVLLTVLIVGLWADAVPSVGDAQGAKSFGDSGGQREEMTRLQKNTTEKLNELISLLKSGEVKVQVVRPGKNTRGEVDAAPKPKK